jgi:hypothetical protein
MPRGGEQMPYFARVNEYSADTSFGFGPSYEVLIFSTLSERDAYVNDHNGKKISITAIDQEHAFQMVKPEANGKRAFKTADEKYVYL